ncbi:MAG TPA: isoamylase early set domain-containing protein [Hanamia sp.]|nr:isoamylase early set domain-containing protein [Hanamia sp.]
MKKNITFTLPAEALEGATEAVLLGDFNNWKPAKEFELKKQKDGFFKTVVPLEVGETYQYRFLLNDGRWVNDYDAQNYVPVSGLSIDNCEITVPETLDVESKQKSTDTSSKVAKGKGEKTNKTSGKKLVATPKSLLEKETKPKAKKAKSSSEKAKVKKVAKRIKKETFPEEK